MTSLDVILKTLDTIIKMQRAVIMMNNEYLDEQNSIDITELFRMLLNNLWIIILVTVIFVLSAGLYTKYGIDKKFESNTMIAIIVNPAENTKQTSDNLRVATELAKRYSIIAKSNTVLENVRDDLKRKGIDVTVNELSSLFSVSSVNDTDILKLKVTYTDPTDAHIIADSITQYGNIQYEATYEGDNIKNIDGARIDLNPVSPNTVLNMVIGIVLGLMLSVGFVLLKEFYNKKIRTSKDLETLGISYLGSIVNLSKTKYL
jgi:capsular polysaccharide biosynthesis protein